ncbi:MAG: hypothetical protein L6R37_003638 [Teloschistes peruensis]|nr:MAG: hypothetical protein L6R37_003638 [Teloschistes peruensis]
MPVLQSVPVVVCHPPVAANINDSVLVDLSMFKEVVLANGSIVDANEKSNQISGGR